MGDRQGIAWLVEWNVIIDAHLVFPVESECLVSLSPARASEPYQAVTICKYSAHLIRF